MASKKPKTVEQLHAAYDRLCDQYAKASDAYEATRRRHAESLNKMLAAAEKLGRLDERADVILNELNVETRATSMIEDD